MKVIRLWLQLTSQWKGLGNYCDGLHPRVLKELSSVIAPVLCGIFRASLQFGVVLLDWKQAYVTDVSPIYKKGSKQSPENYRPISLTCICSKIMEHILVSSNARYLKSHHILNDVQHGFQQIHSCETQLQRICRMVGRLM